MFINFESTFFEVEHVGVFGDASWVEADFGPGWEAAVCCSVATVHEGVVFFGMVTVLAVVTRSVTSQLLDLVVIVE